MSDKNVIRLPTILIPVIFFIVFDSIALILNFWISDQLEKNAVAINLSGRQRMLTQRMAKSLMMLQIADNDIDKKNAFEEFSNTVDLFDKTLTGLIKGGMTLGGDGEPIFLPPTQAQNTTPIIASAEQLWKIVRQAILPALSFDALASKQNTKQALQAVQTYNLKLMGLMNDLTTALEQNATEEVFFLRTLQTSLLILALLNFSLVCKRLLEQVGQSQNNLHALQNIIDSIATGVILYDSNRMIRSANKTAEQLFGYGPSALTGKPLDQLIISDRERTLGIKRDNSQFVAKINTQTLFEMNQKIGLCTIVDVSEQDHKEKALIQMAFYDTLTGLPNRILMMERLQQELLRSKRESKFLVVMFADLDGFKPVNDKLGHAAGDQLLKQVGRCFQQCCRDVDTVARYGGDEFVFILTGLQNQQAATQTAKNIINSIHQSFQVNQQTIKIGISIGIAIYPSDHSEAALLIKFADEAMYLAKQQGKNRFAFASESH
ncbi:MAG: diguanylate cyclase [Methylomonas sp.]|jgi:diguanylate cyclase (GGDEF)-like protein|uniref:diguanylate cyclase domain-containing protein n=1 Tax=Methylomonas sp. TaxID=418 RepID=UPI0025CC13D8|nr:diguanylate cyclase [Methylomonas sp.]MCK9608325.1 diguanylate cyclase [Methylomonas sp.]